LRHNRFGRSLKGWSIRSDVDNKKARRTVPGSWLVLRLRKHLFKFFDFIPKRFGGGVKCADLVFRLSVIVFCFPRFTERNGVKLG
jgi:hypothetical protein